MYSLFPVTRKTNSYVSTLITLSFVHGGFQFEVTLLFVVRFQVITSRFSLDLCPTIIFGLLLTVYGSLYPGQFPLGPSFVPVSSNT